jgi:hypothetical protein
MPATLRLYCRIGCGEARACAMMQTLKDETPGDPTGGFEVAHNGDTTE